MSNDWNTAPKRGTGPAWIALKIVTVSSWILFLIFMLISVWQESWRWFMTAAVMFAPLFVGSLVWLDDVQQSRRRPW